MRTSVLTLVLVLCSLRCHAQLSVEQYQRRVEEYSYALLSNQWAIDAAEAGLRRAKIGYLPRLDAAGDFRVNFRGQRTDDGSRIKPYTYSLAPVISGRIYDGGTTRAAIGQARAEVERTHAYGEFTRSEVLYIAEYAYWNALATQLLERVREHYTEIVSSLKALVEARFEDGYTGKGDLLMVETQLNEAIYNQIVSEQTALRARHNLNVLMGEAPDALWRLTDSLTTPVTLPSRISLDSVLARRGDLRAAMASVEHASWGVKGARAAYNPTISMDIAGVLSPDVPNTRNRLKVNGSAGIAINIPIFAWGERRQSVRIAEAAMMQSLLAAGDLRDQITLEEADSWSDVEQAYREVEQIEASLAIATENLSLATFSYSEGQISVLDVLSAQLSWIQLYTNAIGTHLSLRDALARYRKATG